MQEKLPNSETIKEIQIDFSSEEKLEEIKIINDLSQSVINNYIPLIQIDVKKHISTLKELVFSDTDLEVTPPFISKVYGNKRKKVLDKLKDEIKPFTIIQQKCYKSQFFELEKELSEEFIKKYPLNEKYREYIYQNKLKVSSVENKHKLDLAEDEGSEFISFSYV